MSWKVWDCDSPLLLQNGTAHLLINASAPRCLAPAAFRCQWDSCFLCGWGRELPSFRNVCRASLHRGPGQQSSLRQRSGTETWLAILWKAGLKTQKSFIILCCWGKMGFCSLLTRFSCKLIASSRALLCFGHGPHRGIQTPRVPRDSSGIVLMALQFTERSF